MPFGAGVPDLWHDRMWRRQYRREQLKALMSGSWSKDDRSVGQVKWAPTEELAVSGRISFSITEVKSAEVDREVLARYIKNRLRSIQSCYEKELRRNPNLEGKVLVRFSFRPTGRMGEIEIEKNTLGNDAVASCTRTVLRGWIFPFKPGDDVSVALTFSFEV
ncbi:AgmX/PglI C-terminal domain-containing protein [Archangium violaceum]|nr:AgmX/PglI C-terminal domain-containing protein [Archangium violaceum]